MKSNGSIAGGYLNPESYGAYADHLLCFADFMESNGAPLYAVSIQNEPDVTVTYESCDWTPEQMTAILKEQGPRFDPILVLDASGLPGGIYFIKMKTGNNEVYVGKFMIL
jgi:glucuronoarabinoxylan endo-1,4-beta-xylanase